MKRDAAQSCVATSVSEPGFPTAPDEAVIELHPVFGLLDRDARMCLVKASTIIRRETGGNLGFSTGCNTVLAVVSGQVSIGTSGPSPRARIFDIILPGELDHTFSGAVSSPSPLVATAMQPTTCVWLPAELLSHFIPRQPQFGVAVLAALTQQLDRSIRMRSLGHCPVEGRVAGALVFLQGRLGSVIPERRVTVAALAGTSVESTIRVTASFQRDGLIRSGRSLIEIVNLPALESIAYGT